MYRSLFGGLVFFPDLLKCKKGGWGSEVWFYTERGILASGGAQKVPLRK